MARVKLAHFGDTTLALCEDDLLFHRADQRKALEQLCRTITWPAIANQRLKRNRAGQVVLQLMPP